LRTDCFKISSTNLNEEREINVYIPWGYDESEEHFPVLYLLDGDSNFTFVAATVDYFVRTYRIPPLIVVGIDSTERRRDFTPKYLVDSPTEAKHFSGEAENFYNFLRNELIPMIESSYRVMQYRVIVGHSLGGLFVFHAVLSHLNFFNAYIALSPYLYKNSFVLQEKAKDLVQKDEGLYRLLFVADERMNEERGQTTYAFLKVLEKVKNLEIEYKKYEDADHMSIVVKGIPDALDYIFPGVIQDR
jgi:predicted alpha/beta superfamily hydrolase